jgi:hypothetical protein
VTDAVPLYRLYNLQRGFHYYTADPVERQILVNMVPITSESFGRIGWRDEGIEGFVYLSQLTSTTAIYRLYNRDAGTHLFTESADTKNAILQQFPQSWREESRLAFAFLAQAVGTVPAGGSQAPVGRKAVRSSSATRAESVATSPGSTIPVRVASEMLSPALGGLLPPPRSDSPVVGRPTSPGETGLPPRGRSALPTRPPATEKPAAIASVPVPVATDWAVQSARFFSTFDGRAWE